MKTKLESPLLLWSTRKNFWSVKRGDRVLIDFESETPPALQGKKATVLEDSKHANGFGYVLLLQVDGTKHKVRLVYTSISKLKTTAAGDK